MKPTCMSVTWQSPNWKSINSIPYMKLISYKYLSVCYPVWIYLNWLFYWYCHFNYCCYYNYSIVKGHSAPVCWLYTKVKKEKKIVLIHKCFELYFFVTCSEIMPIQSLQLYHQGYEVMENWKYQTILK